MRSFSIFNLYVYLYILHFRLWRNLIHVRFLCIRWILSCCPFSMFVQRICQDFSFLLYFSLSFSYFLTYSVWCNVHNHFRTYFTLVLYMFFSWFNFSSSNTYTISTLTLTTQMFDQKFYFNEKKSSTSFSFILKTVYLFFNVKR